MYLSKLQNVFHQIKKYISLNCKMYLFWLWNVFVQIANPDGKKRKGSGDDENYSGLWWMVAGDYRDDY